MLLYPKKSNITTGVWIVRLCVFLAGQLIEMFKNVEELKEELRAMGMSNTSIDKLLAIPIPDNRAEVGVRGGGRKGSL